MQKKIKIILLFLFLLLGSFCYAQEIPKTIFVKETIANKTPLPNLGKNEVFTAGDFEITVLERTGTNGIFSGKGFMVVPYLADTKIAVEFNDIKINSDYQMYDGFVFTTYDKTWGNVVDVTTGTGEGAGSQVEVVIQYEIKTIAINPNTGEIIVVGPNGETTTLPGGKDTVITDSKGATYAVDKDGAVVGPMQAAPGGKPTPKNTDGVDKNGQSTEFTASGVAVKFYNVASYNNKGDNSKNSVYALDEAADDKVKEIAKLYKRVKGSQGEDYWLVTKAIENKKEDTFLAEVHITDSKIVSDSIYFRTQNGVEIPKTKFGNHLILTLKGNQSYAEEEVLATIKQDGKWQVAGAFKLVHISPKDISVTLVAMDGATIPPDVEENIRKQYQGLALNFNFTRAKPFSSGFAKDQIDVGDSGWLETYTADQLDINKAFKDSPSSNYKQETYYLFFTNTPPSKSGTQGFMPLKGQFGYIFGNGGAKTPAHELGHGIFGLEHPFQDKNIQSSEGASSWLMDYGRNPILGSIGLPAYHWKQMYDPKFRLYVFQGDSEGENADYQLAKNITMAVRRAHFNNQIYVPPLNVNDGYPLFYKKVVLNDLTFDDFTLRCVKNTKQVDASKIEDYIDENFGLVGIKIDSKIFIKVKQNQINKLKKYFEQQQKNALIFVNGYRFTFEMKLQFGNIIFQPVIFAKLVENPDSNAKIDDSAIDSYWDGVDTRFINILDSRIVKYADGHHTIKTSNHQNMSSFANSAYSSFKLSPAICGLDTNPNNSGFNIRRDKGKIEGENFEAALKKSNFDKATEKIDIVCHSMGYACALGIIDYLKPLGYKFGRMYIIAPENAQAGSVNLNDFEPNGVWQYGADLNRGDGIKPDPCTSQDGVAPQTMVKGLYETNRVYIPANAPKGFIDSHSISNFNWIFKKQKGDNGYVVPR